ncbi:MAG: hypothetical protein H0T51_08020 [Pirellulales bacterium]|nr:hypothetical protein [Pirellulales bacterium]
MRRQRVHYIVRGILAVLAMQLLTSVSFAAFASLNDWVGSGNTAAGNNYTVITSTSAGGTFVDRSPAGFLSDASVGGSPFNFTSALSMSGTVTFTVPSPPSVDPVWFLGWYNSSNIFDRIGLGAANPVPFPAAALRWQTIAPNPTNTGTVFKNLNTTNANSTFSNGTYPFNLTYNGAGNISGTFGAVNFSHTFTTPANQSLAMDRFGFLQPASSGGQGSFSLTISDINYTGESQVPEPSALVLAGCIAPLAAWLRRKKTEGRQ